MFLPATTNAATDENPAFRIIPSDLEFILEQIQISESHAAGNPLLCPSNDDTTGKCVRDPMLPHGLRTVDGTFNNLEFDETYGSADQMFPRMLPIEWKQADPAPSGPGWPQNNGGESDVCEDGNTCYLQTDGFVYDSEPRTISNLIVDQSTNNPAAVDAAESSEGATIDPVTGEVFVPNSAPDEGLSAPFNMWFTFFGQFFDHGLDLVNKGGNGTIVVPLEPDDPLYNSTPPNQRFMMLTRATQYEHEAGPDGVLGTPDDTRQQNNQTTPFVDQNQTYTSHPSHQVFLREYELVNGRPADTGRLLNGQNGGLATWNDVKAQAHNILGIELGGALNPTEQNPPGDYPDVVNVPQVVVDPYGNFVPGPDGQVQLVTESGAAEGVPGAPVSTANAMRTNHAFLDDIAHGATQDPRDLSGYDNVLLGEHFITGDGRGNENIGLTAVHHVFHAEHNRMAGVIQEMLDLPENSALAAAYADQSEADDWDYNQRVSQAARFVTEMQYQHLVFEEFARRVQPNIDAVVFNENSYDSTIDPAIVAEYAHVVYRFGHSMLTQEIDREGFGAGNAALLDAFLNPVAYHCPVAPVADADGLASCPVAELTPEEAAGAIVNGTTNQTGNQIDELVTSTLRNSLLGLPLDLPAINIMRARDVGVPPLQVARKTFYDATGNSILEPYTSWTDFGLALKNGNNFGRGDSTASLVNFVAAYGKHPSVTGAETLLEKRAAAELLVNGTQTVETATRVSGPNRWATPAEVSRTMFETGVPVVYIANGTTFPDALAGGPAAAADGGPILLVGQNSIPSATALELFRLKPGRVVVLGGPGAVSEQVFNSLETYTGGTVSRLSGPNRYATAAAVSNATFAADAPVVYIASGENFPDALSGGAVAARDGAPVLLVRQGGVPAATATELARLNPGRIVVLGGPAAISEATRVELAGHTAGTVTRLSGTNRVNTAVAVSEAHFADGEPDTVYLATGTNFPDALAGSAVAGLRGAPILLLPAGDTVPSAVAAELERLDPAQVVMLGGGAVISDAQLNAVAALFPPPAAPADRADFMSSTGEWAANTGSEYDTITGLEEVDFWVGGLAEALDPFGGMLGSTFNFVFEQQLEDLQFGDRFYYLFRNQGNQLFAGLEANSFSALIQRNTDASLLPADIFAVQDPSIDLENLPTPLPDGLIQMADGQWRWDGDEHIEIHGYRTEADDIRGGQGDDSLWGYGGDDRIEGGSGNDSIIGGPGDDTLTDTFGDDNIKGDDGNDAIDMGPGVDDLALGGHGDDFILAGPDFMTAFSGTGDDIAIGGTGRDNIFGNEGDDWLEGGAHADLLMGDNSNQFQNDEDGGNDVFDAGPGSDDVDAEGGDDIMLGRNGGTDRFHGMFGYDYVTYYGEPAGVDADLQFNLLQPPDVTAIRDRYLQVEALSGGDGNDVIRGQAFAPDTPFDEREVNKMTEEGLDLIDGLEEILRPEGHVTDYALRFMDDPLQADNDGVSNLLLGGSGSDLVQGRFGDDFIDGDAYLRVQLEHDGNRYDSATELQAAVFNGTVNPGDIDIVREIVEDPGQEDVVDTAVYTQDQSAYTLTDLGDGYYSVTHTAVAELEESEGTDIIRNVEVLDFADGCLILETMEQCETAGLVTLTGQIDPPTEDMAITADVVLSGEGVENPTNIRFNWQNGEEGEEWEPSPTGDNLPDEQNGRTDTFTPGDGDAGSVLRVVVTFTDDNGQLRSIASEVLPDVVNVNDVPTQPELAPQAPRVGGSVITGGFTDGDGLEEATEAGITYEFQTSANGTDGWVTIAESASSTPGYRVTEAEEGLHLRARVTYTDDLGTAEEVYSTVTDPVSPALVTPDP